MVLQELLLSNFKNHAQASYRFGDRVNCILGKNGKGKTNLLDAIYYLSFTKSALGSTDRQAITHGAVAFTIAGSYDHMHTGLQCEKGKSKSIKVDGKEPDRLSDVIGNAPLVIVLPDDTQMIKEGSEERRKFFDGALAQFDRDYLQALLSYNKVLKQRNSLLKSAENTRVDTQLLDTYDEQLAPLAIQISGRREELLQTFTPYFEKNYAALHEGDEQPAISYKSQVGEDFFVLLKNARARDTLLQRTTIGAHRDDFEFSLDGTPIKKFGSQGQQKTFILSLKLALYDFLLDQTGEKPLLLLDDIFDKLDDSRMALLVSLLQDEDRFQQIFITDARSERSKVLFESSKETTFILIE